MILLAALATLAIANSEMARAVPSTEIRTKIDRISCGVGKKYQNVALALDCSSDVEDDSWKITTDFAKKLVTELLTKAPGTDVAIIYYSSRDRVVRGFTHDLQDLLQGLDRERCQGGSNFPGVYTQDLFETLDEEASKMLLLVTGGKLNRLDAAEELKAIGVTIFAVGIGTEIPREDLESMCSPPAQDFSLMLANYNELPTIVDNLVDKIRGGSIRFSPSYAPVTGGVYIHADVPASCLQNAEKVYCGIGRSEVLAEEKQRSSSSSGVHCLSPVTSQLGPVEFSIILKKGDQQVLRLPAEQLLDLIDPTPVNPKRFNLTIDPRTNQVTAEWVKFKSDPITLVDLVLQRIETKDGKRDLDAGPVEYVIATDVPASAAGRHSWSGAAKDKIPADFQGLEYLQIRQASSTIGTKPTPHPNLGVPYYTRASVRGLMDGGIDGPNHDRCEAWHDMEKNDDREWFDEVDTIACPPNAHEAKLDCNFQADQSCCDEGVDSECKPIDDPDADPGASSEEGFKECKLHKGATHCVLSEPAPKSGARQQCCYAKTSSSPGYGLILAPPGAAGFPQKSPPPWNVNDDLLPRQWCCAEDSPDCAKYFEKLRPPRNSEGYVNSCPGAGSGDPHFTTMDGFFYTVFGCGEYTLVRSTPLAKPDIGFEIQAYFAPLRMNYPKQWHNVTRMVALAGAFTCKTNPAQPAITMNVYYVNDKSSSNDLAVVINNEIVVPDGRPKHNFIWECNGKRHTVGVARSSMSSVVIEGPAFSLTASAGSPKWGTLNYIVTLKGTYKKQVVGLLGQWDGNPYNDLQPADSTDFVHPRADLWTVYNKFSSTWQVKKEDSLFVRRPDDFKSCDDYDPNKPSIITRYGASLSAGNGSFDEKVKQLCGDDFACQVDALATGDLEAGEEYLKFQRQVEETRAGYRESRSILKPTAWGWLTTPRHPLTYPSDVDWKLTLYKEGKGPLMGYENRVGFLHFITKPNDNVTIFTNGGTVEAARFAGNLQKRSGSSYKATMPMYAGIGPNTTITFQSDSERGASGFLLAYASEIPAEWPHCSSSAETQQKTLEEQKKLERKRPSSYKSKAARRNQKKVQVDMRAPKDAFFVKGAHEELIQLDASGTCGFFMSPNHPYNYGNDGYVKYEIRAASKDERVVIHFLRFATERERDILSIKDMGTGETIEYSGEVLPDSMYLSKSDAVQVRFFSDGSITKTGFLAAYASVVV